MTAQIKRTVFVIVVALPLMTCRSTGPLIPPVASRPESPAMRQAPELSLHFLSVGQGDAALLIAPDGESLMIDDGPPGSCQRTLDYATSLHLTHVDYLLTSHYHADHIGCAREILSALPLSRSAFDRGGTYSSALFSSYLNAVGKLRHEVVTGETLTLDPAGVQPVNIEFFVPEAPTSKVGENSHSVVAVVRFGEFDAVFGGDLSGSSRGGEADEESRVASAVGKVEVYKVHHHCSGSSSSTAWLSATRPKVGIVSVGVGNSYGHPAADCLARLHAAGVTTYWTSTGAGAAPDPNWDVIAGGAIVTTTDGHRDFKVGAGGSVRAYPNWDIAAQSTNIGNRQSRVPVPGDEE
jgi:competence protein ComEC